jgi:inorganic phosphate transporter, PiT family
MFGLDPGMTTILVVCLVAACAFEFINGFHDTANAVATVIYTNSLRPSTAVIWSGICNFIGVYIGGITVAMGIMKLLPESILFDQSLSHNIALISAIILSSIIWNITTWYFGIPCSSSHTLLGSIFGVGIAYGFLPHTTAVALNWVKVKDAGLSLFISPVFGFGVAMIAIFMMKKYIKSKKFFNEPEKKKKPPFWIRFFLILTSTGLSFSHGSNDGQKGVGLIMIILIALAPLKFAVDHSKRPEILLTQVNAIETCIDRMDKNKISTKDNLSVSLIKVYIDSLQTKLTGITDFSSLHGDDNKIIRKDIYLLTKETSLLVNRPFGEEEMNISKEDKGLILDISKNLNSYTDYAPWWSILLISISLGLGTMIGWKRIVITIGEKIGKEHLNYAQGASANLVAAITIGLSTFLGLPVSTTHVLSSGVAGSMVATNGVKNLRMKTVKGIFIAWLVTLPVTIILAGGIYLLINAIL